MSVFLDLSQKEDQLTLTAWDEENHCVSASVPAEGSGLLPAERCVQQLKKTGGTPFRVENVAVPQEGVPCSVAALNGLRRQAVEKLLTAREQREPIPFQRLAAERLPHPRRQGELPLRAQFRQVSQLCPQARSCREIVLPLETPLPELERLRQEGWPSIFLDIPRALFGEEKRTVRKMEQCMAAGFEDFLCGNLGAVALVKELGGRIHGSFGLNIYNTESLAFFRELGLASAELSSAEWTGVSIPNVENEDLELLIHNNGKALTNDDFMTVENFVFFLQMEFLKRHSVRQNLFLHANALVNELLQENLYSAEKVDEALERLRLNHFPRYQALALRLAFDEDSPMELESWRKDQSHRIFHSFLNRLKAAGYETAFEEKEDSLTLIVNFRPETPVLASSSVRDLFDAVRKNFQEFSFQYDIAVSNETTRFRLPDAGRQILEIQRLMRLFGSHGNVLSYDDLGIYKIFLTSDNLGHLSDFIPQKFQDFAGTYPDLANTLAVYLDSGQNLSETAKRLFLHAKTIHYRIRKIQDLLKFDFSDPEQVLQAQISFRLLKLL